MIVANNSWAHVDGKKNTLPLFDKNKVDRDQKEHIERRRIEEEKNKAKAIEEEKKAKLMAEQEKQKNELLKKKEADDRSLREKVELEKAKNAEQVKKKFMDEKIAREKEENEKNKQRENDLKIVEELERKIAEVKQELVGATQKRKAAQENLLAAKAERDKKIQEQLEKKKNVGRSCKSENSVEENCIRAKKEFQDFSAKLKEHEEKVQKAGNDFSQVNEIEGRIKVKHDDFVKVINEKRSAPKN